MKTLLRGSRKAFINIGLLLFWHNCWLPRLCKDLQRSPLFPLSWQYQPEKICSQGLMLFKRLFCHNIILWPFPRNGHTITVFCHLPTYNRSDKNRATQDFSLLPLLQQAPRSRSLRAFRPPHASETSPFSAPSSYSSRPLSSRTAALTA